MNPQRENLLANFSSTRIPWAIGAARDFELEETIQKTNFRIAEAQLRQEVPSEHLSNLTFWHGVHTTELHKNREQTYHSCLGLDRAVKKLEQSTANVDNLPVAQVPALDDTTKKDLEAARQALDALQREITVTKEDVQKHLETVTNMTDLVNAIEERLKDALEHPTKLSENISKILEELNALKQD